MRCTETFWTLRVIPSRDGHPSDVSGAKTDRKKERFVSRKIEMSVHKIKFSWHCNISSFYFSLLINVCIKSCRYDLFPEYLDQVFTRVVNNSCVCFTVCIKIVPLFELAEFIRTSMYIREMICKIIKSNSFICFFFSQLYAVKLRLSFWV